MALGLCLRLMRRTAIARLIPHSILSTWRTIVYVIKEANEEDFGCQVATRKRLPF